MVDNSSSFISTLNFLTQQITIYLGTTILITGVLGGCLNVLVFLSLRTFRESSCAFHLIIMSIFNIGQLLTGLLSQIMCTGFNIDWTQSSLFYCKWRLASLDACTMISLTSACFATIDQYWATSSHQRWQQWCNIKLARCLSAICVVVWVLHGIPYFIYFDHIVMFPTNNIICGMTSDTFRKYRNYISIPVIGRVIPLTLTFIFGLLAYRNVRQLTYRTVPLVRRELDKQLTTMVLLQVVFTWFAIIPHFIVSMIMSNTSLTKDPVIAAQLQLASILTVCLYYMYFAVSLNLVLIFVKLFCACSESILYLYLCIGTISSTADICP
jgi:hypothetical protein